VTVHLALLPGWSYRIEVMQPLADRLAEQYPVNLYELPRSARAEDWLDELDALIPHNRWLIGWSLGGMLAAQLAARRTNTHCPGLVTLCSNPCFYAREDWPHAMPEAHFRRFCKDFKQNPESTLERFDLMVSAGSANKRAIARALSGLHLPSREPSLLAGLELLGILDTRPALCQFTGAQLHLFAAQDAFLPAAQAGCLALQSLLPAGNISIGTYEHSGHAFPFADSERCASEILKKIGVL